MSTYLVQILAGIASGAMLFLVAAGLTLVFGALRIVNFAHGSLYMLGAFLMVSIGGALGFGNVTFWVSTILVALAVAVAGGVMEILFLRPVYTRSNLTQLIVTFGLVLLIGGVVRVVWGSVPITTERPPFVAGGITILGRAFPLYQLLLIGVAAVVAVALWILLYRTPLGRTIRAAVSDPDLLELSGVNVKWLFTGVFVIGAFLAGIAGALAPAQGAAVIGMDITVIVKAFVVVVIGGMGSLGGALVGALLVGIAESLGVLWLPAASLVMVFALLVIVLAVRPQGLFGRPEQAIRLRSAVGRVSRFSLRGVVRLPAAPGQLVDRTLFGLAVLAVIVAGTLPFWGSVNTVIVGTGALVFALFALSLNLLLGTAGLVSFGHALFFGVGAYSIALLVSDADWPPLAALAVTPLIGVVVGLISGVIALRATELYFALLTLGLASLAYAAALGFPEFTGGSNGLRGAFAPRWLLEPDPMYWFIFGCVAFCAVLLYVVTRSPFGRALTGIRENRRRAEVTGIWLKRYELTAFVIAGAFASIAGGLFAVYQLQAFPELLHWTNSALPLIMSLLGGIGVFLGPVLGSFFYQFLNNYVANRTVYWDIIIGAIVILVALGLPRGLAGAARALVAAAIGIVEAVLRRAPLSAPAGPAPSEGTAGITHAPLAARRASVATPGREGGQEAVLAVQGMSKSFGGLHAVHGVTFAVERGSMHAVIGPNGAGKTTLFNLITGLTPPDEGRIFYEGTEVTGVAPWRLAQRGIGRSFQQANLFWSLTSLDNVALAESVAHGTTNRVYGTIPDEIEHRARDLLARVGLGEFAPIQSSELSHGDQRSLEMAAAIAIESKLLLLDEPTAGLSPAETRTAVEVIEQVADEEDLTVVFIEHDMDVVFRVADRITVLHEGRVLAEGTPDEIRASSDVRRAYLGEDEAA